MAIIFNQSFKHGTLQLIPTVPLAFQDERAEAYFIAVGCADATDDEPVHTYPVGTVTIDSDTVFAGTNRKVLSDG